MARAYLQTIREQVKSYAGVVFVAFALAPLVLPASRMFVLTEMLIFALFALGFDFLYGYSGVVSFGHSMFYGLGAYLVAMGVFHLGITNVWVLLAIAILVTALFALVVGWISIRAVEVYFAILTLAWALIVLTLFSNIQITGGSDGIGFQPPTVSIVPGVLEFSVADTIPFYYLVFVFLVGTFLLLRHVSQSHLGAVMQAIRENRERTQYIGYDEKWYRIFAFTVSAGVTGLAGAFSAFMTSFVSPSFLDFILSGEVIVWTIIGGKGTLIGPIIGGALITMLENLLSTEITWWFIPVGIFFIAVVIFLPSGIIGALDKLRDRLNSE